VSQKAIEKVRLEISVVIGKAMMPINQLLKMGRGAVIVLDAGVDDDAWIFANKKLIARGEVVVSGENVAISITNLVRGQAE
jgi:flagellar motor switch protein FliN/FliY